MNVGAYKGKRVLLLTHRNADADALASILLLDRMLKGVDCTLGVADGIGLHARGLQKFAKKQIMVNPDPAEFDLLIIADCSTRGQLGNIPIEKAKKIIVIDHHSPHESLGKIAECHIDPGAASCTLQIRRLFPKFRLDRESAILLLAGIAYDSAQLRLLGTGDFVLVAGLLEKFKLSYSEILEYMEEAPQISERIACLKAAQRAEFHRIGDYLIATTRVGSFEASAARALVRLGADIAFAACDKGEARISARGRTNVIKENGIQLGKDILPKLGVLLGGSGSGHDSAAGANGPLVGKVGEALDLGVLLIKKKIRGGDGDGY